METDTITANSSRLWLYKHPLKLQRYLRRSHKPADRPCVFSLIFDSFPDQGKKLVENFDKSNSEKIDMFIDWITGQSCIVCGIFGDQRMGKDATICYFLDLVVERLEFLHKTARIVTLGNIRNPPFVSSEDMYFSFLNVPSGAKDKDVYIYCSEMETVLPCRETLSPENRLYSQLSGTLAQNHQKLFGCCKLASKVDINFIRDMNVKIFKFITPEKLQIEGVERGKILTELGYWLLPKDVHDKSLVLLCFDNNLLTVKVPLPDWYDESYSEMFRDIPIEKVWEYVDVQFSNDMPINDIIIAVRQKFRKMLSKEEVCSHLNVPLNYKPMVSRK